MPPVVQPLVVKATSFDQFVFASPDRACWRLSTGAWHCAARAGTRSLQGSKLLGRNEDSVAASGTISSQNLHLLPGAGLDRFDHVRLASA